MSKIKNLEEKRNQFLLDAHKLLHAETVTREDRASAKSMMAEADAVHDELTELRRFEAEA